MGSAAGTLINGKNGPRTKSKAIDKKLSKDKQEDDRKFKILLLGGSDSGKSTIFKQMRVLHLDGFNQADSLAYRPAIHANSVLSMTQIVNASTNKLNIKHELHIREYIERFNNFKKHMQGTETYELELPPLIGNLMDRIWTSDGIQKAYQRRFEFELMDSAKYYLDDIRRIAEDFYVPSIQDIVNCRIRTSGINEISFTYNKVDFKMTDVGGQRTERGKWLSCFDNVNMMIFIAAMSDYDLVDEDDPTKNRMLQHLELFKTLCSSEPFRHASIVLFLNKKDVFEAKLHNSPLSKCFPNYAGDNSMEDASQYMMRQFEKVIKGRSRRQYSTFCTTATSTDNIEVVFRAAVNHIVTENLKATGLVD